MKNLRCVERSREGHEKLVSLRKREVEERWSDGDVSKAEREVLCRLHGLTEKIARLHGSKGVECREK
jgi:hypothetical protein